LKLYNDPSNNKNYYIGLIDGVVSTKKYSSVFNLLNHEPKFKKNYKPNPVVSAVKQKEY